MARSSTQKLEELLLPGTPEDIRARYLSFEQEATQRDFGLLEEDVVVLDTETTGLSFKNAELIEIAAARLSGRTVVERFQTYVHPHKPIPPEITALTSIRQADVADAPHAKEAVGALANFVGGMPVLAHNALFDRHFIEQVSGGHEVSATWIDTLSLSRIALPRLSSHRLSDLAEAFGCAGVSHRATDDVDALAGVWRIILCGLAALPPGVLDAIARMHPECTWAPRTIFSQLAHESAGAPFQLATIRKELVRTEPRIHHEDAAELTHPLECLTSAEIDEEFSDKGMLSRMYKAYERRPEQISMAQAVNTAFKNSGHLVVEAGTGTGKSMAYLVPEATAAKANRVTFGVATKTNALTDQLMSHELPALARVLPGGLSYSAIKGYDHYPCLRRLTHAMSADLPVEQIHVKRQQSKATIAQDMLTAMAVVLAYACQSPTGDLDALGIRWSNVPREMLTTTPEQCARARCPFFPDTCFVHGARRRAATSDIVVTNHALLLRNVEADGKILPPIRHWVVDEAHSFEEEARRQWALEFSAERASATFEQLGGIKTGAIHTAIGRVAGHEGSTLATGLLTKAASSVSRANRACAELFEASRELLALAKGSSYDLTPIWLGPGERESPEWGHVSRVGASTLEALEAACKALTEALEQVAETDQDAGSDLADAANKLRELWAAARCTLETTDTSYVYSAQIMRGAAGRGREKLVAEKLDVGAELARRWLPEMMSVVFTSATLAVGNDPDHKFDHVKHAVGLDRMPVGTVGELQLGSSFDFDQAMSVVLTPNITAPTPNRDRYLEELVELLIDIHCAMGGSVLTLFTNRRDMEEAFEKVQPVLAQRGLELFIQDRRSGARVVRDRFIANTSSSLFALKSFWEGFDAGGDTLRCVVIPKLPFASPTDPLVKERSAREADAWKRYSLPEAVISVKQAAGRLIRTSTDSGILILCDSRLATKGYGKAFLASLPSSNIQSIAADRVGEYIQMWRASRKN